MKYVSTLVQHLHSPFPFVALVLLVFAGCNKGGGSDQTTDTDSDSDTETDTGEFEQGPICDDGLPRIDWVETDYGMTVDFGETVPDITFTDLDGAEVLMRDIWTGCETYVFIVHYGSDTWSSQAFSSSMSNMITDGADNINYIVMSAESSAADRIAQVQGIGDELIDIVETYFEGAEAASWKRRIHLVQDNPEELPGIQELYVRYPGQIPDYISTFAVDRVQRYQEVSSIDIYAGGSFVPRISYARYVGPYFNWRHALEYRIDEEDEKGEVFKVGLFDGDIAWSSNWYKEFIGKSVYFPLDLPDAATMEQYNFLEVDVTANCPGRRIPGERHPVFHECEAWDAVASLMVCEGGDGDLCESPLELIRWITPYHNEGRWVEDISHVLPAFLAGGRHWVALSGPDYLFDVDFRFSTKSGSETPVEHIEVLRAYSSDEEDATREFELPKKFARVVATVVPSGHGDAEFSTWTTTMNINGTDFSETFVMESVQRCAMRTGEGVVPNQAGTWFYDRSSWCPGWPVERWIEDITSSVQPGTNEFHFSTDNASGDVHSEVIVTVWQ